MRKKHGRSDHNENITEREELCQNRKENCSEKIRAEIGKSNVEQSGARSVVQNDTEQGE